MYHYMTSHGYIIMIIVDSCMIWFHFDCIMQLKSHIILLLMFVAENVLLLLVISLTVKECVWDRKTFFEIMESITKSLQ